MEVRRHTLFRHCAPYTFLVPENVEVAHEEASQLLPLNAESLDYGALKFDFHRLSVQERQAIDLSLLPYRSVFYLAGKDVPSDVFR